MPDPPLLGVQEHGAPKTSSPSIVQKHNRTSTHGQEAHTGIGSLEALGPACSAWVSCGREASHPQISNRKSPPPQSIWNVVIFGSLTPGTLSQETLPPGLERTSLASTSHRDLNSGDISSGDCSSDVIGGGLSGAESLHVAAMAE